MEFLIEVLFELFFALDGVAIVADFVSWVKGSDNRRKRRDAKRQGLPPPPRDAWSMAVIWLTLFAVLMTSGLVWFALR